MCASEGSIFIEDVGDVFPTLCDFFFLIMCVAVKTVLPSHSENLEQLLITFEQPSKQRMSPA